MASSAGANVILVAQNATYTIKHEARFRRGNKENKPEQIRATWDAGSTWENNPMKLRNLLAATAAVTALTASAAFAAEPEACMEPHFADVGWTDNTAQNGLLNTVLKGLGYKSKIDVLALPIILEGLKNKDL